MTQELTDQIDKFLNEKRQSNGGWAEVKDGDLSQLSGIIDELITAKFEEDPDGDLPVNYRLCDRNKVRFISRCTVPYDTEGAVRALSNIASEVNSDLSNSMPLFLRKIDKLRNSTQS